MAKRNAIQELMNETINYGGVAATREQAYSHAFEACKRPGISEDRVRKAADMFAFGPKAKAIDEETAATLLPFEKMLEIEAKELV